MLYARKPPMKNHEVIVEFDGKRNFIIDAFPDYKSAKYLKISLLAKGDVDDERKITITRQEDK